MAVLHIEFFGIAIRTPSPLSRGHVCMEEGIIRIRLCIAWHG